MSEQSPQRLRAPSGGRMAPWLIGRILTIVAAAAFLGYMAWAGWGNFLGVQSERLQFQLGLTPLGWVSTVGIVVLPVVVFLVAMIVTRRMRLPLMIFVFAMGIALTAVVSLDVVLALPPSVIYVA